VLGSMNRRKNNAPKIAPEKLELDTLLISAMRLVSSSS
jgi:hypothetical protein